MRAGDNLLIFPEGTRTVQTPVNPFKMGFALMATLADAPIQTVFVEMSYLYLGKRWEAVARAGVPRADHDPTRTRVSSAAGAECEGVGRGGGAIL